MPLDHWIFSRKKIYSGKQKLMNVLSFSLTHMYTYYMLFYDTLRAWLSSKFVFHPINYRLRVAKLQESMSKLCLLFQIEVEGEENFTGRCTTYTRSEKNIKSFKNSKAINVNTSTPCSFLTDIEDQQNPREINVNASRPDLSLRQRIEERQERRWTWTYLLHEVSHMRR